ncbi:MAG TPA: MDR family MFS transporter [Candidatus Limnocylindrales bacterium]|nr:MDR family MFS transporter [Candidatus Limnocylindrales bacterium]
MPHPTSDAAINLTPRQKLEILGAILLAMFLFALDQTVVGTALPRIISALHGETLYTWSVTIYLLTSTISGPIYGKLSDLFGRRPIVIFAVSLFLISSALAGLSQNMEMFILFRGLQGLGGGAVFPIALAVVADLYTPAERGKYLGLFGAVFGVSSLVGPGLGGFITDTLSWNWIFYINIPIGLVSLFILWRLLPAIKRPDAAEHIDYVGAAVFTAAIAPFLVGLSNKQTGQWTDPAVGGLMLVGLVFGAIFLWVETRAVDPIVPLDLFRLRTFSISVASMFLAAFGFFTAVIFLPRWFQTVGGASATESGYNLLPLLAGLIFSAIASGQIVARVGRYKILMAGSLALLALALLLFTNLRADTDRPVMWLWMALAGLGIGPSFAVFTLIVQNAVSPDRIGVATSSLTFFQQIGGTVGLTLAGTLLADKITTELPAQIVKAGVPPAFLTGFSPDSPVATRLDLFGTGDLAGRLATVIPPEGQGLIPAIVKGVHEAFSIAIASTFWIGIIGGAVAAVLVLFLHEVPMRQTFEVEDYAPEHART